MLYVHTTCPSCGTDLVLPEGRHDGVHRACPPSPRRADQLAARLQEAAADEARQAEADELADELDALDDGPPRLLDAALIYAGWGWPVLPLGAGLKTPLTRHGLKDASTHADQLRVWWARWPTANVGLRTGVAFDVADVDPGGLASLPWLREHPTVELHVHGVVITPRGLHLYVPTTGLGNRAGEPPGTDYRGQGGYVVAPPSRLGDGGRGQRYLWLTPPSPSLTGLNGSTGLVGGASGSSS